MTRIKLALITTLFVAPASTALAEGPVKLVSLPASEKKEAAHAQCVFESITEHPDPRVTYDRLRALHYIACMSRNGLHP